MNRLNNKPSFSRQLLRMYIGAFLILFISFVVLYKKNEQLNAQKNTINLVEKLKFELHKLTYRISKNNISKIAIKTKVDSLDTSFGKLVNLSSAIYNTQFTDSTNFEILLLQEPDREKHFFKAYKNWKYFMFLIDENIIKNKVHHQYTSLTVNKKEQINQLIFTRNTISSKLSSIQIINTQEHKENRKRFITYFFVCLILNLLFIYYLFLYTRKSVIHPIEALVKNTKKIARGTIKKLQTDSPNNEINKISTTINKLVKENQDATNYIKKITSRENSDSIKIKASYAKSQLFTSILEMQNELNDIAQKEKERKWVTEGQAVISGILNRYNTNFEVLTNKIIQELVKYTGALQGGLFTVTKDAEEKPIYLELVASYAYDRNKFTEKRIYKGEGVLGQIWIENKGVYLENIPDDHMEIKSFVGNTAPESIMIETLIDNKEFYGVIELASLKPMKPYEREFVTKIAESIAATLASVENNNRTRKLLEESQHMTVQLKTQEEKTFQNLQKLKASQEEIKRRETQKENELKAFTEQFSDELNKHKLIEENNESTIKKLKKELLLAETDNDVIRNLKENIEAIKSDHLKAIVDLEETIKIKDLRLVKNKRKIDRLLGNNDK